jgi:Peptidase M1 N-terminal domain
MRRQVSRDCFLTFVFFVFFLRSSTFAQPAAATSPSPTAQVQTPQTPTEADILRGAYGPDRANNDLLYYHLDIRVDPEKKFISGKNTIRFKMLKDDTRIQLDLTPSLNIDKILLGTDPLKYEREFGAVFVDFPRTLKKGRSYSIDFYYSGTPVRTGRFGAFTFGKDPQGRAWIYTACEGIGASMWWPNKDRWRDEVKNMRISVSIPSDLVDVSNGKFVGKTDLGDGYTRWDWFVHYPINNYDVSLNIGNYVRFSDQLRRSAARFLRTARRSRQSQETIRPGQGDARGLSALFRRISLQERRLQTDRSALFRDGAPERCYLWKPLCKRISRARLDRRRHQPEIRFHYHPRKRTRVVWQ